MFGSLTVFAASIAMSQCAHLSGLAPIVQRTEVQYLLFGEYHGTIEMPELVANAVCDALDTAPERPLVVAVELPAGEQAIIDRYMASDGSADARAALLAAPAWSEKGGRSTLAILNLSERLRRLGPRRVTLVAFDALPQPGTSAERETAMADALKKAVARRPNSLAIVLTGVGHADKKGWVSETPPFASAAGNLPPAATISLAFARPGGQFWGCHPANGGPSRGCAAYDMPVREPVRLRGIELDPKLRDGFDGIYSVGRQYSASTPAATQLPSEENR